MELRSETELSEEIERLQAELARREREAADNERQLERYAADLRETFKEERARSQELSRSYMATVRALSNAVEARDAYTGKHAERVAAYGIEIARALGLPRPDAPEIEFGFLLHDIGKVAIPDAILYKPGRADRGGAGADGPPPGDRRRDRRRDRVPRRGGQGRALATTSAGTATAIRTAWPARRSRSRRGCSRSPTCSTR